MQASLLRIAPIWLQSNSENDVIKCSSVYDICLKNVLCFLNAVIFLLSKCILCVKSFSVLPQKKLPVISKGVLPKVGLATSGPGISVM